MGSEPITAGDAGVVLQMKPSTFWLRLRLHLMIVRRRALLLAVLALVVGLPVPLLASVVWDREWIGMGYGTFALWTEAIALAVVFTIALVSASLRSVFRSETESFLPREITFLPSGLLVQPRRGKRFETNWTWIQRARASDEGLDLVISESPPTLIHVRRVQVGEANFATLRTWLAEHGRL